MNPSVAFPRCYVDIYPFEGGVFSIQGDSGNLLNCTTNSNVRGGYGTFTLVLAPGGPYGPNITPQWTDILTPMSLVIIGMQRAGRSAIVMVGVVKTISEDEAWRTGAGVQRAIVVSGFDFGYFFLMKNYYTQSLLNATIGAPLGLTGSLNSIDQGLVYGSPSVVGAAWYNKIMAGPGSIMDDTTFSYQGSRPKFFDIVGTFFQPYSDVSITIPLGDNFMSADGTWMDKFRGIFPFPWYEFFTVTAPNGIYPGSGAALPLNISAPGFTPANPQVIARVNPLPWTKNLSTGSDLNLQMQFTGWDALPRYQLDTIGAIDQHLAFSDEEVRNFYIVNPIWLSSLFGITNDNQVPFTWLFASWLDSASIHRYGYRPEIAELHWFADLNGLGAQQAVAAGATQNDFEQAVANLTLKLTSYHEPTALMTRGTVITNIRPDILPGNRFLFAPHKDVTQWEYYIEGVSHSYQFGGPSVTSLSLSRGLPVDVYNDDSLMLAMHTGNAMRQQGRYVTGLPAGIGNPLEPLNLSTMIAATGDIAKVFAVPGQK